MTEEKKNSVEFEIIGKACAEITKCLEENKHVLPKGHIAELKQEIAQIIDSKTKNPTLKKQLSEFNALCKKYANQVHCLYETRDLARWEHYTRKMDLCRKIKKLNECTDKDLPQIARELKFARMRWNDIGSVPHEKNEEIWKEFCKECDKLQKRIYKYYDGLKESRKGIAVEKIKICEEAEEIQSSTAWEKDAQKFKNLQKRWREVGFTAPEQEKKLYLRFRGACDVFFNARKGYYNQAKSERENISSVKFQLCEEAKTIFDLNYSEAHRLIPDLWKRWKAAGSAGKSDRELYYRFRNYFDTYYDDLRKQRNENLKIKKKICKKLEALDKSLESGKKLFDDIKEEYSEAKKMWNSTGAMPRAEEKAIMEKHSSLCEKLDSLAMKSKYDSKYILKRSFKIEQIVSAALDSLDSKKIETWEKCQADWEAAQSTEKKYFSDSFDKLTAAFEDDSAEDYEQLHNIFNENLKKRREICKELEGLGIKPDEAATKADLAQELTIAIAHNFGSSSINEDPEQTTKRINQIAKRWLKAGTVPLKNLPQLYKRFEQAMENIKNTE